MATPPSNHSIISASSESIDLGNAQTARDSSVSLAISNVSRISALLEDMRSNKSQWAIGDQMGNAYYFLNGSLYKQGNVLNRAGLRNRLEIRNQELFFEKLASVMLEQSTTFVEVQLCGKAAAELMYCHSTLQHLEPKRRMLLLGQTALVQGCVNNYYSKPTVVATGTCVQLYGRTFYIQVSSNQHTIYMRVEDIIKNRVRLVPRPQTGGEVNDAASTLTLNSEDEESTDLDDVDNEDSEEFERDSDTSEGSQTVSPARRAGAARIRPVRRRRTTVRNQIAIVEAEIAATARRTAGNATVPADAETDAHGLLLPGGIRALLFRDATVQTENNDVQNTEEGENDDDARPQRPHSV